MVPASTSPDSSARSVIAHPRARDLIALFAGGLMPLAFAPFAVAPFAVVAPAILFALWRDTTPRLALWRGWLFGLGMFGFGVSWVVESFQYSQITLPMAVLLTAVLVVFLALFPALLGFLVTRFRARGETVQMLLVVPAAWTVAEWARGTFLTGFTWLQLGYSQTDTPLVGLAPAVGVYGVSWCVALGAALLAWGAAAPRARWWIALALVASVVVGAGALESIRWTERAGLSIRAVLVQGNVPQGWKWRPEALRPTLERYVGLTRAHWDADLVVWPETALPGTYRRFADFLAGLEQEARRNRTDLLIGVPREASDGRFYNSLVSVGTRRAVYDKRHLVPFGEYLPLKPVLQPLVDWLDIPVSNFSRGMPGQTSLEVAGQRVGVSICYEAAFGAEIIDALPEATMLVNVSNDAWFGDSIAPPQHLQIARMRAIEGGRYLLRATNTGISAVIGPYGELVARSRQFEVETVQAAVFPMRGATPYVRFGDAPILWALGLAIIIPALVGRARGVS